MRPFIFITNDDGVNAKGLAELIKIARQIGDVMVLAPETAQSGMSHAITMSQPIFLREVSKEEGLEVFACTGTPVDCVKLAMDTILKDRRPDLILSGINHGSNSAINVIYSGTMGAAIEGSFYNIPSVGFSLTDHNLDADFGPSVEYVKKIINDVLNSEFNKSVCLNVNIPDTKNIKGVKICRQNKGYWREDFEKRTNPQGRTYYWLSGFFINKETESTDTDEWALANNYISIVPIAIDFTDHQMIGQIKSWSI